MKTAKQINEIKALQHWTSIKFHGNKKYYGSIPVNEVKEIVLKKRERRLLKYDVKQTKFELIKQVIIENTERKGTNYFKMLIEGNSGIYLASPIFGHSDYNKTRLFDKTPENLTIMDLVNKIINR